MYIKYSTKCNVNKTWLEEGGQLYNKKKGTTYLADVSIHNVGLLEGWT